MTSKGRITPNPERLEEIVQQFVEADLTDRHRQRSEDHNRNIYGITPKNAEKKLDTIFNLTIQGRSRSPPVQDLKSLAGEFEQDEFLSKTSHGEALDYLTDFEGVGQKIANDFLRKTVDVYQLRNWRNDLHVPLDTHVIKGLIKTGALDLRDQSWPDDFTHGVQEILNADPYRNGTLQTKVGYHELQNAFRNAAEHHGLPRIVFDELWVEHKYFLTDPLMQSQSCLVNLLGENYRID